MVTVTLSKSTFPFYSRLTNLVGKDDIFGRPKSSFPLRLTNLVDQLTSKSGQHRAEFIFCLRENDFKLEPKQIILKSFLIENRLV